MKNSKYFLSIYMSKNKNIYTTCWVYIQTYNFKKYAKINTTWKKSFFPKRPFHWLTTYFGKKKKKRKENKYKVEKHHIYTTQWHQYTPSLILNKKTHTKQYYLKTVQLNKYTIFVIYCCTCFFWNVIKKVCFQLWF